MEFLKSFFEGLFGYASRVTLFLIGALWGLVEPTIPFAGICLFAILIDCFTAWRLGKRVKKQYPKAKPDPDDAKVRSSYARRMFYTLCVVYACTVLGWLIDTKMFPFAELYLASFISGGFCLVQLLSILENESSCNDARWAKVLQKVLVNKAARHLDIAPEDLQELHQPEPKPKPKAAANGKRRLEETCGSKMCGYRGKGVCDFVEGMYCPMYLEKEED